MFYMNISSNDLEESASHPPPSTRGSAPSYEFGMKSIRYDFIDSPNHISNT